MRKTAGHIRWGDLLDQYKHRPRALLSLIDSSRDVRSSVKASLGQIIDSLSDWPAELRDWRVLLLAMLEIHIGGIMSPYLRSASHKELLSSARRWGVTRTALKLASGAVDDVYDRVRDEPCPFPERLLPEFSQE